MRSEYDDMIIGQAHPIDGLLWEHKLKNRHTSEKTGSISLMFMTLTVT